MGNSIKNPFKVALCIIGTLVGAGFASGQEIMSFFIIYGKKSFWGLVIFTFLLALYLVSTLNIMQQKKIDSYNGYLNEILPQKLTFLVEISVVLFMFSTYVVMLSGFGAVVNQTLFLPNVLGAISLSMFCYFVFLKNATGIVNAGAYLTPIIIVFIALMGILSVHTTLPTGGFGLAKNATDNFVFSSIIYVSYNTLSLTPVLIGIKDFVKTKKDITLITLLSATILGVMAIFIWYSLVKFDKTITYHQIPTLDVADYLGGILSYIYPVVLFAAMLTTAVSAGFGFLTSTEKILKIPYKRLTAILCVLSVPLSQIGFSSLISHLYSFFGYVGVGVFLLGIMQHFFEKVRNQKKNRVYKRYI